MTKKGTLPYLVSELEHSSKKADVTAEHIWYAVRGALDAKLLISSMPEALRISAAETEKLLIENGFGDLVAQSKLSNTKDTASSIDILKYLR